MHQVHAYYADGPRIHGGAIFWTCMSIDLVETLLWMVNILQFLADIGVLTFISVAKNRWLKRIIEKCWEKGKIDGDDLCIWKSSGIGTPSFSWKSVTLLKAALTDVLAYFLSSFKMSVSVAMSEVTQSGESEPIWVKSSKEEHVFVCWFWGNGEIFCSFSGLAKNPMRLKCCQ